MSATGFGLIKGGNREGGIEAHEGRATMRTDIHLREESRVGRFLQQQTMGIRPDGKPVRFTLRHVANGNRVGDLIGAQQLDHELEDKEVTELAHNIYATAENDASGLGGKGSQRYIVQSFHSEDPGEPSGRIVFEIRATGVRENDDGYLETEPATSTGLVSAVMQQNKQLHGQTLEMVEAVATLLGAMQGQIRDLSGELRSVREERRKDADAVERARSEAWARERDAKLLDTKINTQNELVGGLHLLLPAIARRIGLVDSHMPIAADEVQLIRLAESMTPTQLEQIMMTLDEKQRVAFMEWFEAQRTRATRIEERQKALAAPPKVPLPSVAPPAPVEPQPDAAAKGEEETKA